MNWKDKFNRPMELGSREYRLAKALKELKRRVDNREISEQEALRIMEPLSQLTEQKLTEQEVAGGEVGNAGAADD